MPTCAGWAEIGFKILMTSSTDSSGESVSPPGRCEHLTVHREHPLQDGATLVPQHFDRSGQSVARHDFFDSHEAHSFG
jgi:hypothetical protein